MLLLRIAATAGRCLRRVLNNLIGILVLGSLFLLLVVDVRQVVDVLLLLPSCPDEVTIRGKALFRAVLPPVTLLKHALNDRIVVAMAHPELLSLVDLALLI